MKNQEIVPRYEVRDAGNAYWHIWDRLEDDAVFLPGEYEAEALFNYHRAVRECKRLNEAIALLPEGKRTAPFAEF